MLSGIFLLYIFLVVSRDSRNFLFCVFVSLAVMPRISLLFDSMWCFSLNDFGMALFLRHIEKYLVVYIIAGPAE